MTTAGQDIVQGIPAKGTVWKHATRTEYDGSPRVLTVTSVTQGKVYSRDSLGFKFKTPVGVFSKFCLEIVSVPELQTSAPAPKMSLDEAGVLYAKAHIAGMQAGEAVGTTPMIVQEHANPLDDSSPVVRQYAPVMDGPCGFAYVTVRPGNSTFARYLKQYRQGFKAYYGGTQFSVHPFGQSLQRKTAYADAFAKVLRDAGIRASYESRID